MFETIDHAKRTGTSISDALFVELFRTRPSEHRLLTDRALRGLCRTRQLEILRDVNQALNDAHQNTWPPTVA